MGTNEKSGQLVQKPEYRPDEHFATRRKILAGLAGTPVFMTINPYAGGQARESFARCVNNELNEAGLPTPTTDLSNYGYEALLDQDGNPTGDINLYNEACDTQVAMLSSVCLASFVSGGGKLPTNVCPAAIDAPTTTP